MTQQQFKKRIKAMLKEDGGIANVILNTCLSAMASEYAKGRYLNAAEDNFILPKTVLSAVFTELAWQYKPHETKHKNLVNELKPRISIRSGISIKKVN